MARNSCVGTWLAWRSLADPLISIVPEPAHLAPYGEGNLLTGRMTIDQTLACSCHLLKQYNRTRSRTFPVPVECHLRLLRALNHCPPLRIPDFLSISAALRECARNNVEVFKCSDDLWWWHDTTFPAVRLRVLHQHALGRSATGATAEPVPDEVIRPAEERAQRKTLTRRCKSGLGSGVCEMPIEMAHIWA
jgi:hypothetical protein